jgi:hypothetical protein
MNGTFLALSERKVPFIALRRNYLFGSRTAPVSAEVAMRA